MPRPGDEDKIVVVDNGSAVIKAGIAGDDDPRTTFPTLIGRPKQEETMVGADFKDRYIGEEAQTRRAILSLTRPIERGIVIDWDSMECIWNYIFEKELGVNTTECPVLLSETMLNPEAKREKMTEIMFETFRVPSFFVSVDTILSMYASGLTTGLVFDSGHGVTTTVPIYDGFGLKRAARSTHLAGDEVTHYLEKLLKDRGYSTCITEDLETVRDMKEKLCYANSKALDPDDELPGLTPNSDIARQYELPDGQVIEIGPERSQCVESLFQPDLLGIDSPGIHRLIFNTVMATDIDLRKELFKHIVLAGGTTMIPNLKSRLQNEVTALAPANAQVRIVEPPSKTNAAWIGGSILGSLRCYAAMWITKEAYEERGAEVVRQMSFRL